jgi:hypothetical protein
MVGCDLVSPFFSWFLGSHLVERTLFLQMQRSGLPFGSLLEVGFSLTSHSFGFQVWDPVDNTWVWFAFITLRWLGFCMIILIGFKSPWRDDLRAFLLILLNFSFSCGLMIATLDDYKSSANQFAEFLVFFKAVHSILICKSQDQDNGSQSVVGNYLWDTNKMLLDSARPYIVALELCSLVFRQLVGVVHLLGCSTLALVSSHLWFVSAPKLVRDAMLNDCNR